jgi:hypothetical protein
VWKNFKWFIFTFSIGFILGTTFIFLFFKDNSNQRFDTIRTILDDSRELDRRLGVYHSQLKQTNTEITGIIAGFREQIRQDNLRHREQIEHILISFRSIGEGLSTAKDIIRQVKERIRRVREYLQSLPGD